MRKMMIITLAVVMLVVIGIEIAQSQSMSCQNCPQCGQMGHQIGKQKVEVSSFSKSYIWVYVYRCAQGHVWQCT